MCHKIRHLTHIDVSDSPDLTDVAFETLAVNMNKLVVLNISRCYHITDYGLRHILNHVRTLRELHLCDCYSISDYSLSSVLNIRPSLQFIDASGTMITRKVADDLRMVGSRTALILLTNNCPFFRAINTHAWRRLPSVRYRTGSRGTDICLDHSGYSVEEGDISEEALRRTDTPAFFNLSI